MSKGYMYILKCSDGSYYTGSTLNLEMRLAQHQWGEGANHTKTRLPVTLVYFEEYHRIDEAFSREKQVQGWSRKKKEALIQSKSEELHELAMCMNETSFKHHAGGFDSLRLRSGLVAQGRSLSHRRKPPLSSARFSQKSKKLCSHAINAIFHFEMGVPETILGYVCTKKEKQKW